MANRPHNAHVRFSLEIYIRTNGKWKIEYEVEIEAEAEKKDTFDAMHLTDIHAYTLLFVGMLVGKML